MTPTNDPSETKAPEAPRKRKRRSYAALALLPTFIIAVFVLVAAALSLPGWGAMVIALFIGLVLGWLLS